MVRDKSRGSEVFLDQCRRHRQRFTGIVKPRLIRWINREFARGTNIDTGEITNRMVIFRVTQSAGEHNSRITRVTVRFKVAQVTNPFDHFTSLRLGQLVRSSLGRHLSGDHSLQYHFPDAVVLNDRVDGREITQVKFALLLLQTVASKAVLRHQRPDPVFEGGLNRFRDLIGRSQTDVDECKPH